MKRPRTTGWIVAAALALSGCGAATGTGSPGAAAVAAAPGVPTAIAERVASASTAGSTAPADLPWESGTWIPAPQDAELIGVWLPHLDIASGLLRLGLNDDGTLQVPWEYDLAGWYTGSPRPGDTGPAIVAGHVDSESGPAVFHRLREVEPGEHAHLVYRLTDGTHLVQTFVVTAVEQHDKDAFPSGRVYGDTERPELRLITCGGRFDRGIGHYEDNLVAYATIDGTWRY